MLKFRPLTADDFPLLLDWLSRPHVREWWDDGDDTLEKVAHHYGEEEEGLERFILLEEEERGESAIGYFQHYPAPRDGAIGIDQFIGEESHLNRGIGGQAVSLFIKLIMREHRPVSIILDPAPENKRAIRCYEKVGFKHYETRQTEEGELAYMMRLAPLIQAPTTFKK